MFARLPQLKRIRVNGNEIVCDCDLMRVYEKLRERNVQVDITCQSPSRLSGKSVRNLREEDIKCQIEAPFENFEAGSQNDESFDPEVQLVTKNGPSFLCQADHGLNLEEFETDNELIDASNDESFQIESLSSTIKRDQEFIALKRYGKSTSRIIRLVTESENAGLGDGQFQGQLFLRASLPVTLKTSDKVSIHCPESGTL